MNTAIILSKLLLDADLFLMALFQIVWVEEKAIKFKFPPPSAFRDCIVKVEIRDD